MNFVAFDDCFALLVSSLLKRIAVQMEMGTYDMEEAPDWMLEEESSSEDDADENDFDDCIAIVFCFFSKTNNTERTFCR